MGWPDAQFEWESSLSKADRLSLWSAYNTTLLIAIVISIVYFFNQSNRILLNFSIALSPTVVFGALVMAILTVIQVGLRRDDRLTVVWFSFMLALFLWFLSEVIFYWYPLAVGITPPYPSLADAFDLAAYLPLMVGLLMQIWPFRAEAVAEWKTRAVIVVVVIVSVVGLWLLLPPIFREGHDLSGAFVSLAYPILDVIALSIALSSLMIFARGTFWRPYIFLIIGLVLACAADIYSGFVNLSGTYYSGHPLELIFDFAFLSVALGFYLRRKQYLTKLL